MKTLWQEILLKKVGKWHRVTMMMMMKVGEWRDLMGRAFGQK